MRFAGTVLLGLALLSGQPGDLKTRVSTWVGAFFDGVVTIAAILRME